ncbi:MAG: class I SAM-dependent methyltransferase [Actinomycetota bacterium]
MRADVIDPKPTETTALSPAQIGAKRRSDIDAVHADPPLVHGAAPEGVWRSTRDVYAFLAEHLPVNAVTLETGLGLSTVLFSQWTVRHTCIVPARDQVDRVCDYARTRNIDVGHVDFEVGTSDLVLPTLDLEPLDLLFIDGGHGFPHPAIDWYYGSLHLKPGGIVVIDDAQLPAVHDHLIAVLEADPRWEAMGGNWKWRAFRKVGDFSVCEEWTEQGWLGDPRFPLTLRAKRLVKRLITRN